MKKNATFPNRFLTSMVLMLVATLSLSAQDKITLKLTDEPLPKALQLIEQQGGKSIIFSVRDTEKHTISVNIKEATQSEAINQVLRSMPFVAKEQEEYFVIQRQNNKLCQAGDVETVVMRTDSMRLNEIKIEGADIQRNPEEIDTNLRSTEISKRELITEVIPSINIVGISTNKKSVALGGLANIVREKAYGMQIGGLYNHFGMGGGLAIGGLSNTTSGPYYGIQVGGLFNLSQNTAGVQIGGLLNCTQNVYGLQVAGALNVSKDVYGLQVGGLFNLSKNTAGLQIGGLLNCTQNVYGLQVAGALNVSKDVYGLQIAGAMNTAQDAFGIQVAGVANIVKRDVHGIQFAGVTNVAKKVKGVQFASVLNIAEESDFPIGLINIIKNGDKGVSLTYDMMENVMVSFRSGGRYTYGILGVGYNQQTKHCMVGEAGYGIHIPLCKWLQVNNEVKATAPINTSSSNFSYLITPSITLWKHCNLFGGPSLNYHIAKSIESESLLPKDVLWRRNSPEDVNQCLYLGYQVGVQYIF